MKYKVRQTRDKAVITASDIKRARKSNKLLATVEKDGEVSRVLQSLWMKENNGKLPKRKITIEKEYTLKTYMVESDISLKLKTVKGNEILLEEIRSISSKTQEPIYLQKWANKTKYKKAI